jgi:uncharacterized protein YndB with AHSA1/START domain
MEQESAGVVTVERHVNAPAEAVWKILADGWVYPMWVVGASRVRDVDTEWPAVGALIHHSVGLWPGLVDDTTEVLRCEPPREIKLRARAWPAGAAEVVITVEDLGPETSRVTITEDAVSGPGKLLPRPGRQLMIKPRNEETLLRLALLAEGRYRDPVSRD